MDTLIAWFNTHPLIDSGFSIRLVSSIAIFLVLWGIRTMINKVVAHQTTDLTRRYNWRKNSTYVTVFFGLVLIGRIWIQGLQPILTFLGIVAAALTISLKEAILNGAGFVFILWRDLFVIGDRIQIGDNHGDVVGIGIFYFTLLEVGNWVDKEQSTGRIIKVPNSLVITSPIANYTKSFPYIWDEISVRLTFSSNWEKARSIMQQVGTTVSSPTEKCARNALCQIEHEVITFHYLTPKVYIKPITCDNVGMELTLRYLCEPRQRRDNENNLWEQILNEFAKHEDIRLATD